MAWFAEAVRAEKPDAVICTGDLTQRATHGQYAAAAQWFSGLGVPVMVLHGRGDQTVPFAMGERLAAAAGVEVVELPGGHNDGGFLQTPELIAEVGAFLDAVTLRPSDAGR